MKAIRTEENLIGELHFDAAREHAQLIGAADRHGEDVPHGMFLERIVAEPEPRADFGNPGLILREKRESAIGTKISAAIADARNVEAFFAYFSRRSRDQ